MAGGGRLRRAWNWLLSRSLRRWADAHRHFGNLYGNQEEHWAAIENYTRAVTLDPTYTQAYYSRGVLYWREIGNHYRAIKDLTRVLELDPSWSLAYFNRGLAHRMRRETREALADFARYLDSGSDPFWLEAARRQMDELQEDSGWVRPSSDKDEPQHSSKSLT
ncbi:MAG: tetratricopeptide repeat protein [Anaerolineae bacterium]|jgi:tetratricopeptide (TPR) repeat protein